MYLTTHPLLFHALALVDTENPKLAFTKIVLYKPEHTSASNENQQLLSSTGPLQNQLLNLKNQNIRCENISLINYLIH